MIYIVPLFVTFLLSLYFDFIYKGRKIKLSNQWYKVLLILFICISGFAYQVGSDIPGYMREYDNYSNLWRDSGSFDIMRFDYRQPGWVLLNVICTLFSKQFYLLKIVIAVFVNTVVFQFIKKHTDYKFLAVFIYSVTLYLTFNFNALRQSVAVAFFLLGYDFLIQKKLLIYYVLSLLAVLFHSSAIICLLIPLFTFIRINNKKTITIITFSLLALTLITIKTDISQQFLEVLLLADLGLDSINNLSMRYIGNIDEKTMTLNTNGLIVALFRTVLMCYVFYINMFEKKSNNDLLLLMFFIICVVLDSSIPVVFYRMTYYFYFIFFCAVSNSIGYLVQKNYIKYRLLLLLVSLFFIYIPFKNLFIEVREVPFMKQFYPYYSIFNPKIDPDRSVIYGSYSSNN